MLKTNTQIEAEFDEKFPSEDFRTDLTDLERETYFLLKDIKSFILQTRSADFKTLREQIEGMRKHVPKGDTLYYPLQEGFNDALSAILDIIPKDK